MSLSERYSSDVASDVADMHRLEKWLAARLANISLIGSVLIGPTKKVPATLFMLYCVVWRPQGGTAVNFKRMSKRKDSATCAAVGSRRDVLAAFLTAPQGSRCEDVVNIHTAQVHISRASHTRSRFDGGRSRGQATRLCRSVAIEAKPSLLCRYPAWVDRPFSPTKKLVGRPRLLSRALVSSSLHSTVSRADDSRVSLLQKQDGMQTRNRPASVQAGNLHRCLVL